MGCGSSKSAVAVINNDTPVTKEVNVDHFAAKKLKAAEVVTSTEDDVKNSNEVDEPDVANNEKDVESPFIRDVLGANSNKEPEYVGSNTSIQACPNGSKTKMNDSNLSLSGRNSRDRSAASVKSKDSGVFEEAGRFNSGRSCDRNSERVGSEKDVQTSLDRMGSATSLHSNQERIDSARSQSSRINSGTSVHSNSDPLTKKPPSGKSSARKKLLRLHDDLYDGELNVPPASPDQMEGQNLTLRPKSRFGNVAFDIVLDTPETGNTKKRPEKLAALSVKHKKPKKVKTKKDIDKKMEEAEARRKIQEGEKLLKAKQFQHFPIITPVETFHPDADDEEDEGAVETSAAIQNLSINGVLEKESLAELSYSSNRVEELLNNSLNNYGYTTSNNNKEENETVVEPFRPESDDDDTFDGNLFPGRVKLPPLVAC